MEYSSVQQTTPKLSIDTSTFQDPLKETQSQTFRTKSASRIPQHHGSFEYTLKDWQLIPHAPGDVSISPPFTISQNDQWILQVFPEGKSTRQSGNVVFALRNLSRKQIRATCTLKMTGREQSVALIRESDRAQPFAHAADWEVDTGVTFTEIAKQDSEWLQEDGSLHVIVEMTVCGHPETLHGDDLFNVVQPWHDISGEGANVPTLADDLLMLLDTNASILNLDSGAKIETTTNNSPENPDTMLWKSDITLVSEQERISCHQCILAARSRVFCEMLQSAGTSMKMFIHAGKLFVTKHVHPTVLRAFVHFLYTDHCNEDFLLEDDGEHLCCLLRAASKYEIKGLLALCSQYLITTLTTENAAGRLALAHVCHGTEKMQAATLHFIAVHSAEIKETEGFQNLDAELYRLVVGEMTTSPSSSTLVPRQSINEGYIVLHFHAFMYKPSVTH
jgi:hypothetical protein